MNRHRITYRIKHKRINQMKNQTKQPRKKPTKNATPNTEQPMPTQKLLQKKKQIDNMVKRVKTTCRIIKIPLDVPLRHYNVITQVANMLECSPETILQKALNHALRGNTLGHVVESMLGEKYHDVFNNYHNLEAV
jgi:hypothetical protein